MSNKYSIRRDSLISPWGVGAIVPFPHDESLMVSGLDFWFDEEHNYEDFLIVDERLSKRLGGKQFVMPPDYREFSQDSQHAEMKIPAVRFPLWHYCPVCGNMEKSERLERDSVVPVKYERQTEKRHIVLSIRGKQKVYRYWFRSVLLQYAKKDILRIFR